MLRDVFYFGKKPNAHPREQFAKDYEEASRLATTEHFWIINELCDYRNFDWDFDFYLLPDEDVWAQDHINVFPSQWQKDSGTWLCSTELVDIRYTIYRTDVNIVKHKNERNTCWTLNYDIELSSFDFSWHPDPTDPPYIYVWGNQHYGPEIMPTVSYEVPGATDYKYMYNQTPKLLPHPEKFKVYHKIKDFDFSWVPNPKAEPYNYVWGNKWVSGELRPTVEYLMEGATAYEYNSTHVDLDVDWSLWEQHIPVDATQFDFTWTPDPREPAYIYVWGNKWFPGELEPTLSYKMLGATEIKYMPDPAPILPIWDRWEELIPVDKSSFDFSWIPDPREPAYIYVWGNQWNSAEVEPTLRYVVPGATEIKYMHDNVVRVLPNNQNWNTLLDVEDFDYSWRPHPGSPPYNYVFGNQWNNCFDEKTVVYEVPGATEIAYVEDIVAKVKSQPKLPEWETLIPIQYFDFSWRPNPHNPPYIYMFGNKWNDSEAEPTLIYHVEGATEYKFIKFPVAITEVVKDNWTVSTNPEYTNFDYSWRPHPLTAPVIYEWPNNGPVYNTPGAKDKVKIEFNEQYLSTNIEEQVIEEQEVDDKPIHQKYQTMFWVDRGNSESLYRFEQLKQKYPMLQKTRFLNTWVDTISRCANKADSPLFWVLNSELDYTDFEFNFTPNPWQMKMVHVFGTQWSHWGNTYLINRDTFNEDTKYVKVIEHLNVLNFVKDKKAKATNCLYNVLLLNFGNSELDKVKRIVTSKIGDKKLTVVDYDTSYLQTFKNILDKMSESPKEHYMWICSSVCDYANFDFTYICDPYAKEQLHVFPSDHQKYGDTFLVNINKLRELIGSLETLEQYNKVNFNDHQRVRRLPPPQFTVKEDTHTIAIKKAVFDFPYAVFTTYDNEHLNQQVDKEPISLWQPDHKVVLSTSTGSSRIVVPKETISAVKHEIYDYPYIKTSNKLLDSNPLDIVFLSNGELCADSNYEYLVDNLKGKPNKLKRIDGINGRVEAYHACANASNTPWFFTVFAKLLVNPEFDWNWQPDRLQVPKHYIFNATNPLNGLCYGHQAMIAYNKNLVLGNRGRGLDFTLDDYHESVDMDSGTALFNTDEFSTWRTAFREAIKLKVDVEYNNSDIAKERLDTWLTVAEGDFADWCLIGAGDAIEYFEEVDGDVFELRESYEWAWLRERFNNRYK